MIDVGSLELSVTMDTTDSLSSETEENGKVLNREMRVNCEKEKRQKLKAKGCE